MVEKVISGGQTGVDRAALDAALELGIPCGGWCPQGRRAEDGIIPGRYPMQETSSSAYPMRTEMNIEDSDGTVILTRGSPVGGTLLTLKLARKHRKPYILADPAQEEDVASVREWCRGNQIRILNVAGPRESEAPGIYYQAFSFLKDLFINISV
jgi:predicted Rossmann-fold nucleotide-binding protein